MSNIINNALLHYVYVYLDPRKPGSFSYGNFNFNFEPFYVGKGKGLRSKSHLKPYNLKHDNNKLKVNKLKKIIEEYGNIEILKYIENISESDSSLLEKEMIATIGRLDKKEGPLTNLTDGGEGISGYIMSDEQKENLRIKHTGFVHSDKTKENMSKIQLERQRLMTKEEKEKFKETCRNSYTTEMREALSEKYKGEKNPNFGTKWSDEQRKSLSDHTKQFGNFVINNPQKINPNRGTDSGLCKYRYLIYDLIGNLIYNDCSLAKLQEQSNLEFIYIKKFSSSSHFYNGFYITRIDKDDENIVYKIEDIEILEKMKDYDIRYKIGKKLGLKTTLVNYHKYIVMKCGVLLLETYFKKELISMFGEKLTRNFRHDKYYDGADYEGYYLKKEQLTENFLI